LKTKRKRKTPYKEANAEKSITAMGLREKKKGSEGDSEP
jgi:hypothetical protein